MPGIQVDEERKVGGEKRYYVQHQPDWDSVELNQIWRHYDNVSSKTTHQQCATAGIQTVPIVDSLNPPTTGTV
ncbi:hypothetical protein ECG_04283 [Echinococcus granulosus]|uniref:Expressed protein n=1 Tax=Echinococcus granulosus TaxID=6210 RepID=A0A068WCG0_ECHGR|nr:hypothetical protein ECG_04283 [Echinococcus granulosus]CDS17428.1 expressed protein [Echinococcus granulosus]